MHTQRDCNKSQSLFFVFLHAFFYQVMNINNVKIAVVGLGYVGLPLARLLRLSAMI